MYGSFHKKLTIRDVKMKKEEFIAKLRNNLSVLEEKEIADIIEEYEQHIDMKMKNGLSQEEAIEDFGDLKILSAEILEAYHVRANYKEEKKNIDFDKVKEESRKATKRATNAIGKGAESIGKSAESFGKGARTVGEWVLCRLKKLGAFVKRPFISLNKNLQAGRSKSKGKGVFAGIREMIFGICKWVYKGIIWCVRIFWNFCCLMLAGLAGFGMLICIFAFGMLAVLAVEGYPVAGIILFMLGCGLAAGAVMLFFLGLLRNVKVGMVKQTNADRDFPDEDEGNSGSNVMGECIDEKKEDNELKTSDVKKQSEIRVQQEFMDGVGIIITNKEVPEHA